MISYVIVIVCQTVIIVFGNGIIKGFRRQYLSGDIHNCIKLFDFITLI